MLIAEKYTGPGSWAMLRGRVPVLKRSKVMDFPEKVIAGTILVWIVYVLLFIGFWVGLIWVAIHFISKWW